MEPKVLWRIRKWQFIEYTCYNEYLMRDLTIHELIEPDGHRHEVAPGQEDEEGSIFIGCYPLFFIPKDVKKRIVTTMKRLYGAYELV